MVKLSRAQRDRLRTLAGEHSALTMPAVTVLSLLDAADAGDDARALLEFGAAERIAELTATVAHERQQREAAEASHATACAELALLRRAARTGALVGFTARVHLEPAALEPLADELAQLDDALEAWRDYTGAPSSAPAGEVPA